MNNRIVLEVRDIVKTFPGVRALDGVQLQLRAGEVHAVVGENGAGKSTLMHVLGGIYKPDSGTIMVEGKRVQFDSAYDAARHGIAVVFQELSLAPNLSVAENIFANRQPVRILGMIDYNKLYEDTREILKLFDLDVDPKTLVKNLPVGQQQVVEILKAMSTKPKVLILDEPTSSLTSVEAELLFKNIRRLKQEGISFIYISHHLQEIFEIADRVTVFRDGRYVGTRDVKDVTEEQLVQMMVGRELVDMYGHRDYSIGEVYFSVKGARRGKAFADVSLSLRRGEILGLAGLVGSGRTELGRAIFGAEPLEQGEIILEGKTLAVASPKDAIEAGIGYLTEDRKAQGLFLDMAMRDNCIAPHLETFANQLRMMDESAINDFAMKCRRDFNIVTPSIKQQVRNLSGGNQQKVLLSMWMGIKPKVLIVDEPTRGVDVGAKSEIYRLLRQLASTGVGIIMISSDLPEVLGLSDRILVMREGRIVGEFSGEEATEEKVIACATGVAMAC
ncbi:MAG TPA: sugar ABC transporter ATP-binding protein [Firmicutes bacterium]|nr:sugar ABC transporter ATP-binding protein [Bacillota bacterium]